MHPHTPRDDDANQTRWLRPELVASWKEIALVVALVIGQSTVASTWRAWKGSSQHYLRDLATNPLLVSDLTVESAVLGLFFIYLHRRGWRPSDFQIRPSLGSSLQGILLVFGMLAANSITVASSFYVLFLNQNHYARFLSFIAANSPHLGPHSIHVSWLGIIPAMVLNAFFEEITCMSFTFCQFAAKRGPLFALILTVLLRMSCHTYQGGAHALGIGATFLVSGLVYWRTRNLWPLVLAHTLVDISAMAVIKYLHG